MEYFLYDTAAEMEIAHKPRLEAKDQFAAEMDHFALCVQKNLQPHTPGEEEMQDQRVTDVIYESARSGKVVKLALPPGPTRARLSNVA